MELRLALHIARSLMDEHGLSDWKLVKDRARKRLGQCNHTYRTISLSGPLIELNDESVIRNTVLHEIAHALVGPHHGHDYVWVTKARSIGCTATRTSPAKIPQARYVGTCPSGHTMHRDRMTDRARRGSCVKCSPRYNEAYRFTWVDTRVAA